MVFAKYYFIYFFFFVLLLKTKFMNGGDELLKMFPNKEYLM